MTTHKTYRRGLTLFELVVVLAILAAVTAVVSVATDKVLAQRRFEMTQKSLAAMQTAILGGSETDTMVNTPDVAGFVADVGRLPLAIDVDPRPEVIDLQPAELWSKPAGMAAHGVHTFSGEDDGVSLTAGWRGPYLRLPPGATRVADGWGRSPILMARSGVSIVPATEGQQIVEFGSLGADYVAGITGDAWSKDLGVLLHDGSTPPALLTASSVTVRVMERSAEGDLIGPTGNGSVVVKLFYPEASAGVAAFSATPVPTPAATIPTIDLTVRDGDNVVYFPTIGPKVVRAYWKDSGGNVQRKSQPLSINIVHGGQNQWDLILPTP